MSDAKEDSSWSLEAVKEKIRDWESRDLFKARSFEYIFLWIFLTVIVYGIFAYSNLLHTDADSARYMLSALVQSQAAIIAIVVSLTLIAVQLTASSYSPRVIRIFKKNPDMWLLLIMYGYSIFLGLLVLKTIPGVEDPSQIVFLNPSLEAKITAVYALGISTFVILCLYVWNILGLLTSETIINRLATEITKDSISNSKEDPIQPVVDIVHGSIMKYDIATTRAGLKAVTDRVIEIIDSEKEKEISERFCTHLERVSKLAISKEDEEAALEVVNNLGKFGRSTSENRLENAATRALNFLILIGRTAAEKEIEYTTLMVASNLGGIGIIAAEKELERAATAAVSSLGEVGRTAAGKGIKNPTTTAVASLGEIGSKTAEKGFVKATEWAVESLHDIGEATVENGLEDATMYVVMCLRNVGKAASENELKGAIIKAISSLLVVGTLATEKDFELVTSMVADFLGDLTQLNEEVVKTAIQNFDSTLRGQDRYGSLQKIMTLYKQKLERLRAEKKNSE